MFFQIKSFTEKAMDVSHAYLLLTIYLYLDCLLSYTKNIGLIDIDFEFIKSHMTVGGSISSIALFILFMASVPATITTFLGLLGLLVKYEIIHKIKQYFDVEEENNNSKLLRDGNKVQISKFEEYAVQTNNYAAFLVLQKRKHKKEKNLKLIKYCTTFVLFLTINISMAFSSYDSVISNKIWSWVRYADFKQNSLHVIGGSLLLGIVVFAILKMQEGASFKLSKYDFIYNYGIDEFKK